MSEQKSEPIAQTQTAKEESLGFFETLFVLVILAGIAFASSKWHSAEIRLDTKGNIEAVTKSWWGISQKSRTYKFSEAHEEWKEKEGDLSKVLIIEDNISIPL